MSKKIQINLQPGGAEKKKKEFLRHAFKRAAMIEALIIALLLAVNLVLTLQAQGLKNRLSLVKKEWEATEPLLKERDYFLEWKDGYLEVFNFLKNILKRDLSWYSILRTFSYLVPEEMWFNEVAQRESGANKVLEISASIGYLETDEEKIDKINTFIESAKKDRVLSEYFDVPDLRDVTKAANKFENRIDLKFSLTLKNK
jgi:hypothetical protein